MAAKAPAASSGGFGGFFGMFGGSDGGAKKRTSAKAKPTLVGPKGLYVWGGTGTGKTFMMDMFHDAVPVKKRKRVHFHEWMIDVHERLHRLQKGSSKKAGSADDLVAQVANEMIDEAWLLCFDEFQVTHISDAIIMKRIFEVLFQRGCVVVATSNRPPEDLYKNGLNRSLFMPFIPMLKDFCEVYEIGAEVDYRLLKGAEQDDDRVYITPDGPDSQRLLEDKFQMLCNGEVRHGEHLVTQGRRIEVPRSKANVAWFDFKDLCDKPLGAADYLAVAQAFDTVFISGIPKLTLQERDQVRRFITLIDSLYEKHTQLVCVAERDPITLFEVTEEEKRESHHDEIFAWDRTVSRLTEMQSTEYLMETKSFGENFLAQIALSGLSDVKLAKMWKRYDVDNNNRLCEDELRQLFQDIVENEHGQRNVPEVVFQSFVKAIDFDNSGDACIQDFNRFFRDPVHMERVLQGLDQAAMAGRSSLFEAEVGSARLAA